MEWIISKLPRCGCSYCFLQGYIYNELDKKKPLSVLLLSSIYTGHLMTLVSIGEELMQRGHKVTLVTSVLNGSHTNLEVLERVGVKFVSSGYHQYLTVKSLNEFHKQLYYGNITLKNIVAWLYELSSSSVIQAKNKLKEIGIDKFDIIICDNAIIIVGTYFHIPGRKLSLLILCLLVLTERNSGPYPYHGLDNLIN